MPRLEVTLVLALEKKRQGLFLQTHTSAWRQVLDTVDELQSHLEQGFSTSSAHLNLPGETENTSSVLASHIWTSGVEAQASVFLTLPKFQCAAQTEPQLLPNVPAISPKVLQTRRLWCHRSGVGFSRWWQCCCSVAPWHSEAPEDGSVVLPTDSKGLRGTMDKPAPERAGIDQLSGLSALIRSTFGERKNWLLEMLMYCSRVRLSTYIIKNIVLELLQCAVWLWTTDQSS